MTTSRTSVVATRTAIRTATEGQKRLRVTSQRYRLSRHLRRVTQPTRRKELSRSETTRSVATAHDVTTTTAQTLVRAITAVTVNPRARIKRTTNRQ